MKLYKLIPLSIYSQNNSKIACGILCWDPGAIGKGQIFISSQAAVWKRSKTIIIQKSIPTSLDILVCLFTARVAFVALSCMILQQRFRASVVTL